MNSYQNAFKPVLFRTTCYVSFFFFVKKKKKSEKKSTGNFSLFCNLLKISLKKCIYGNVEKISRKKVLFFFPNSKLSSVSMYLLAVLFQFFFSILYFPGSKPVYSVVL